MPSLSTLSPVPKVSKVEPPYRQIAEHYRDLIRRGQLLPGDPMPSIAAISNEWEVATSTAGRVVVLLRDEGWIVTSHGKPTVVAPQPPDEA